MSLLSIRDLRVEYRTARGTVAAIPEFSLDIAAGESFGLVGESGCGKSTLIMAIMGYMGRNGAIPRGQIMFEGQDLAKAGPEALRRIRGGRIAIVDFAAHDREELRSQHAHARLGFTDEQMLGWLGDAGFTADPPLAVAGLQLTVKIWTGRRVAGAPLSAEKAPA